MNYQISIVIPLYMQRNSVLKTLDSILIQNFPLEFCEIIVADDCSNDGTYEIVSKSNQWKEITTVFGNAYITRHATNKGLIGNFDFLFSIATGQIIIPIAGDDWIEPNCMNIAWNLLKDVEIGMAFTNGLYEFENGASKLMYPAQWQYGKWHGNTKARPDAVRFYTQSLYKKVGLPSFLDAEGVWLIAHALGLGECRYSPEVTFHYRIHAGSATSKCQLRSIREKKLKVIKTRSVLKKLLASLSQHSALNVSASQFVIPASQAAYIKHLSCIPITMQNKHKLAFEKISFFGIRERLTLLLELFFPRFYESIRRWKWKN